MRKILIALPLVFLLLLGLITVAIYLVFYSDLVEKPTKEPTEEVKTALPEKTGDSLTNRQAWKEHLKWSEQCEKEFVDNDLPAGIKYLEFYQLSEKEDLVQVLCYLGAYQGVYEFVYFNEDTREAKQLSLKNYYKEGGIKKEATEQNVCGSPYYEDDILTSFCKGRALGDCGHVFKYKFNAEKKELETIEVRVEEECQGNYDRDSWEIIYSQG